MRDAGRGYFLSQPIAGLFARNDEIGAPPAHPTRRAQEEVSAARPAAAGQIVPGADQGFVEPVAVHVRNDRYGIAEDVVRPFARESAVGVGREDVDRAFAERSVEDVGLAGIGVAEDLIGARQEIVEPVAVQVARRHVASEHVVERFAVEDDIGGRRRDLTRDRAVEEVDPTRVQEIDRCVRGADHEIDRPSPFRSLPATAIRSCRSRIRR